MGVWYEKVNLLSKWLPVRVGSLGSTVYRESLELCACLCLALANITITLSLSGAQGQFYQRKKETNKAREVFFMVTIYLRRAKPLLIASTNAAAAAAKSRWALPPAALQPAKAQAGEGLFVY